MMLVTRPKSIAEQVNELLRERIREGEYPPGGRLPSESELSQEFGVSRATIRTALARLSSEGLILRKQGDGTYVNERIQDVNTHLGGLWEFSRLIESSGYQADITALEIETRPATEEEAGVLGLQAGDALVVLKRLFSADSQPAILATNLIPASLINGHSGSLEGQLRIREFLERYCQRRIAYVITEVQTATAQKEQVEHLHRQAGTPLLVLKTFFYDRDNHPLAYGHSFYDDQVLRLRLVQAWG